MIRGSYYNGFAPRDGMPLCPSLWQGCVGAWAPCLGSTGLTLRDWAGTQKTGTFTNLTAANGWVRSQGLYAVTFTSAGDSINLAASNSGPLYDRGTGDFAIALWMATASSGTYLGCLGNMTTFGAGILLGKNTTNWGGYLGNSTELNSGYAIPTDGSWHHYGVQRSGSTVSWWVDGTQTGTTHTNANSMAGTSATTLGFCNGYSRWVGNIDDVRIYSQPLNANQWRLLASRRGIAYDLAPFRVPYSEQVAGFQAAWALRQRLILGGGGGLG